MRSMLIAAGLAFVAVLARADDPPGGGAGPPPPAATEPAVKFARVVGWPSGRKPVAPRGFRVDAFASGLDSPRWLLALPNGDVLVAESRATLSAESRARIPPDLVRQLAESTGGTRPSANRISLLRDADHDGVAERREALLTGLDRPFGMLLKRDRLYVASTDGVWSVPFLVGQVRLSAQPRKLFDLPAGGYNNHWTRTLATDPAEQRLYVAVGSATNVDEERIDAKDPQRAAILSARWDGSEVRVHASGLRNPVGMAFEPHSGRLWTVVNERDLLGDELVPDYLTSVQAGGFYGWPYSYFGANEDPRRRGERPDLVARALVPDHALPAHSAPLGLAFYRLTAFPERYRGGAFIGLHGSWNRSRFAGYRVAFVPFRAGKPAGPAEDFLTGFIKDETTREVYGRPAGVAVLRDGSLLVADDAGGVIWRVSAE